MKKKILSLLVLMFIGLSMNSQSKSKMEILTSGKWHHIDSIETRSMGYYFTPDSMVFLR